MPSTGQKKTIKTKKSSSASETGSEETDEEDSTEKSNENEAGDSGGFFTQPTSQKLIAEKQNSKLEFMRRENEQLR